MQVSNELAKLSHKGWNNYSTWSIAVMVNNTEKYYNKCKGQTADLVKEIITRDIELPTNDAQLRYVSRTVDLSKVNWDQIVDSLK